MRPECAAGRLLRCRSRRASDPRNPKCRWDRMQRRGRRALVVMFTIASGGRFRKNCAEQSKASAQAAERLGQTLRFSFVRSGTTSIDGTLAPDSIRPTVDLGTPARSASSACVMPDRRRASRTIFAMDMFQMAANWLSRSTIECERSPAALLILRSFNAFRLIPAAYARNCITTGSRRISVCNRSDRAPATR